MLAEAIVLIPKSANKGTEIQMNVLPLVLCKDCKNRGTSDCPIEELCNGWIPSDDWFCADGAK